LHLLIESKINKKIEMKNTKQIFLFIFTFISIFSLTAQNCITTQAFFTLNKGLIIDFKPTQEEQLDKEALKILNVKEAEICENFGVFDVVHYRIKGYATDGYTEDVAAYKAACAKQKSYYVIFIRKYDENLNLIKIQVELSLPMDKRFSCLSEMQRNLFKIRLEQKLAEKIALDKNDAWIPEMAAIILLQEEISKLVSCCKEGNETCNQICPTKEEMKIILAQEGFISLGAIRVKPKATPVTTTAANVSNKLVALEFEADNIVTFANEIAQELAKRKPSKIYLTDDDYYCQSEGLEEITKQYDEMLNDFDVMLHLSKTDDKGNGELWVKIEGELFEVDEKIVSGLAKFIGDPAVEKAKIKIINTDLSWVPFKYINNDLLAQHKDKISVYERNFYKESIIFDMETNLFWGLEATPFGSIVPDKEVPIIPTSKYNITLIRLKTKGQYQCFERKNVVWSSNIPPKETKNLPGKWEDLCKISKPDDPNDFVSWEKLRQTLAKYNVEKTYFKHISFNSKNKPTYIDKDNIDVSAPPNGTATIIEIKENGDGTITPKVTMRNPNKTTITRALGKGKSGEWDPSSAKPAFEASFKEAIKEAAKEQDNTSDIPKINPKIKSEAETILKEGWQGLPQGVSGSDGIKYEEIDILEKIAAGIKTFNEVVDNAKIPDEMWQNPNATDFPVKDKIVYPSGVLNGGMSELKGGVETFGMIADAIVNPKKTASALKDFASGLTSWDGATKAASGFATGIIGLDLDEYNKGGEYQRHASGVVIGTIAAQAVTGSLVLSLTDIKNAPKKFNGILDKLQSFNLGNATKKYSESLSAMAEQVANKGCDVSCLLGKVGCLTGNTLIETTEGEMQPLHAVKEGDLVSSYNHSTQQKELKSISKIQRFFVNSILMLTLSTGNVIEATPNHPFYVRGEYRQAQDLHLGDTLFSKNDKIITLNRIFAKDTTVEVFNLVVGDNDNYFAGEDAVLTKECLLKNIGEKFSNLNDKLTSPTFTKEARSRFLTDMAEASDNLLGLLNDPTKSAFKAWEKLSELVTDKKLWVSKNETLIKKLDADPAKIDKVKDYYNSHTFPEDRPKLPDGSYQAPPFTIKRNIDGVEYNIEYDELGHPKFEVGYASISKREYKPTTPPLDGGEKLDASGNIVKSNADYENAAQWFVDNNPNASFPNGHKLGIIVDGKYYTMHHLEDGKTIVPVLGDLHNACAHTGGASVIRKGLQGFFE
jgi:hypothetical protein